MSEQESDPQSAPPKKRRATRTSGVAQDPEGNATIPEAVEVRRARDRERQRRKRERDRIVNGLPPPTPRAAPRSKSRGNDDESVIPDPNEEARRRLEDDERRQKVREAARLRQRKHRAAVKARRVAEMNNPHPNLPDAPYAHGYGIPPPAPQLRSASASFGAPPGLIFADTLLLALSSVPSLKKPLMRTYNLQEEDMPSLEHAIYSAFEHWNHGRYASHPAYAGMDQDPRNRLPPLPNPLQGKFSPVHEKPNSFPARPHELHPYPPMSHNQRPPPLPAEGGQYHIDEIYRGPEPTNGPSEAGPSHQSHPDDDRIRSSLYRPSNGPPAGSPSGGIYVDEEGEEPLRLEEDPWNGAHGQGPTAWPPHHRIPRSPPSDAYRPRPAVSSNHRHGPIESPYALRRPGHPPEDDESGDDEDEGEHDVVQRGEGGRVAAGDRFANSAPEHEDYARYWQELLDARISAEARVRRRLQAVQDGGSGGEAETEMDESDEVAP